MALELQKKGSQEMVTTDQLKIAITAFLGDYSIEATPHDAGKLDTFAEVLKPGTSVYVAHIPGTPLEEVVEFAGQLQGRGFNSVPHIVARKLRSREHLATLLSRLEQLGISDALIIAGDEAIDDAAYDSSLEVLETGLFERHSFRSVGVSGHPEGSKAIGDERAMQALIDKSKFAEGSSMELRSVTQFGFDGEAITNWEAETTAAGVLLPIHVGVAGPASLRQLVRFAMKCGIGSSAKVMMTRAGATANLIRTKAPDDLIAHFARHRVENDSSRLRKLHFFCFGGLVKTATWANAVRSGNFEINGDGSGFKVES